jgi:cell division septum initiation protein DivIVA
MAGDAVAPLPPAGFEVVRRGYDQEQVEAHLRRLDAEMRILATDRDAAVDQSAQLTRELDDSRARAERLRAQVRTLVSPQQSVQGMSERMRSMLRMAEDEVAEMLQRADNEATKNLHDAEQKAAGIVEEARAEADAIRMQSKAEAEAAEEADTRRRAELEAAESAHHERLAASRETAEREISEARARLAAEQKEHAEASTLADADAERRRSDAWTESENQRRQVEADFRIAMDQRRKEALSALTAEQLATRTATEEMRERAHAEGRRMVEAAQQEAARIVADARAAVGRLREQRQRIVAQLAASRADLDQLVTALGPLRGEQDSEQATPPTGSPVVEPAPAFTPTPHAR